MTDDVFRTAELFIQSEARIVERRLFETVFRGAPAAAVSAALGAFRNADGGFGWGLEPDKRCPVSQPLDTEVAFQTLATAGHPDPDLLGPACDHLSATADRDGAVPLCTPAIEGYPRAGHLTEWTYTHGPNPTAGLAGLLHRLDFAHPWRDRATDYCWRVLEAGTLSGEVHGLNEVLGFLAAVPDRERAEKHAPAVLERIVGAEMFHLDPHAEGYGLTPLWVAPAADSPWRSHFTAEQIDGHLDKMLADQQPDGGWPITWDPPSADSRQAWRGIVTLANLRTLISYGRIPAPA